MKKIKNSVVCAVSAIVLLSAIVQTSAEEPHRQTARLGGQPFGVKFYNDGVIIINTEPYYDGEKYVCPAKSAGLKINDIIKAIDGKAVYSNEQLAALVNSSDGKAMRIDLERDGKALSKIIAPQKNIYGCYQLGAWVRDSCAGIGTVTYYDSNHNYFAALGHGICDNDTSALLPLGHAEVVSANISSVEKSENGKAGSLNGYFADTELGKLEKNTDCGVFGVINGTDFYSYPEYEIAENSEISVGKAQLVTTIEGAKPRSFDIEIKSLKNMSAKCNENFVIKITDPELLEKCGGIVQGMSGSPIIQNNRLVGAVTHVFVNRVNEGWAITAQNMVSNYQS